jgi:hypothetical protein
VKQLLVRTERCTGCKTRELGCSIAAGIAIRDPAALTLLAMGLNIGYAQPGIYRCGKCLQL